MKNMFVIKTDDENFKEALSDFLEKHCNHKAVNAAVYEINESGAEKIMKIVNEE